jgi:hypothetical protein
MIYIGSTLLTIVLDMGALAIEFVTSSMLYITTNYCTTYDFLYVNQWFTPYN